jgi:arylsulfatase A-like enzyme
MNRRWINAPVISALVAASWSCAGHEPVPNTGPNVLLVSLDALRADHLSSHGYHRRTTPFLDELAAQGTRFSHATINTHGTPPSHTTMFSSLYQETHRVGMEELSHSDKAPLIPAEIELLPEILRREGWTTVGVTGGAWMSSTYGFSRGFDHFSDQSEDAADGANLVVDTIVTALASGRPVFAFFHTYEVHSPYRPPEGYVDLFGEFTSTIQPTWPSLRRINQGKQRLDQADLDFLVSQYDGEIRYVDDCLRELFRRLTEIGFLDNAVVLVTADHGEEFGDHGGLLHRDTLFEELVRVPFILWGHGVPAGVVDPALVSAIDIAPTLLAATGNEVPPAMEGRNVLAPDTTPWADQRVFAQYGTRNYSVRTPRFKLIRNQRGHLRLFDLTDDPRERRNLASARPELAADLDDELEQWRLGRPALGDAVSTTTELDPATEDRLRALGYLD